MKVYIITAICISYPYY